MTRLVRVLMVIFIGVLLFASCLQGRNEQGLDKESVHVSLFFENSSVGTVCLEKRTLSGHSLVDSARLNEKGRAFFSFSLDSARYYKFSFADELALLFLEPGDSLSMMADMGRFDETLTYEGKGNEVNDFLARKYLLIEKLYRNYQELFDLPLKEFRARVDSFRDQRQGRLNVFLQEHQEVPSRFARFESARILYTWGSDILSKIYYQLRKGESRENLLNSSFEKVNTAIDPNARDLLYLGEYRSFLKDRVGLMAFEKFRDKEQGTPVKLTRSELRIASKEHKGMVRDVLLYDLMVDHIEVVGLENIGPLVEEFRGACENRDLKKKVDQLIEQKRKERKESAFRKAMSEQKNLGA